MAELAFTKHNVVLLLLVACQHQRNGMFLADLISHQQRALRASGSRSCPTVPSRATWYNYFCELRNVFPNSAPLVDLDRAARKFCTLKPHAAEKFYRKFGIITFNAMRDFLIDRGLIDGVSGANILPLAENSLYFSIAKFIGPRASSSEDHVTVPGVYRVFRPSLTSPGKVLVSSAKFFSHSDGSLHYHEKMHFRSEFGWREQFLDGYLVGVEGHGFLITRDDNSRLVQMSILKPINRRTMPDGTSRITMLFGSYSGASSTRVNGLFSTGIVMVRDRLPKLERYPVRQWKTGLLDPFGLKEKGEIPKAVLNHLYE